MFLFKEIVKNACIMIKAAQILQIPIIVTEQYPKGIGRTAPPIAEALGDFHPIEKVHFSCFKVKEFLSHLQKIDRKNLMIMGIESHVCINQTVQDAIKGNYRAYVLEDTISSRTEMNHRIALQRMRLAGAIPSSAEMVIFELLMKAGTPEFKEILQFVK